MSDSEWTENANRSVRIIVPEALKTLIKTLGKEQPYKPWWSDGGRQYTLGEKAESLFFYREFAAHHYDKKNILPGIYTGGEEVIAVIEEEIGIGSKVLYSRHTEKTLL